MLNIAFMLELSKNLETCQTPLDRDAFKPLLSHDDEGIRAAPVVGAP
jgi:hypothetical protein